MTNQNKKELETIISKEVNVLDETEYLLSGENKERLLESVQQLKEGKIQEHELIRNKETESFIFDLEKIKDSYKTLKESLGIVDDEVYYSENSYNNVSLSYARLSKELYKIPNTDLSKEDISNLINTIEILQILNCNFFTVVNKLLAEYKLNSLGYDKVLETYNKHIKFYTNYTNKE